jgi:RNA polymerase sigma factor (sigma-70 family)
MARSTTAAVRHLHAFLDACRGTEAPDSELVERFAGHADEAAFAALLRRHGPMVLGLCRRLLHHNQDAEDTFQATFLVLARKAHSMRKRASVGSWLYGVAYRLACKARARDDRRRRLEGLATARRGHDTLEDVTWRELRGLLDEELARLPESYRVPLMLCYFEGLTQDEAAQRVGCLPRTLKARLQRGRELLRRRLSRRGLTLAQALIVPALTHETIRAAVPQALAAVTPRGALDFAASGVAATPAAVLAQGAIRELFAARLKLVTAVLLVVGLAGFGLGGLFVPPAPEQPIPAAVPPPPPEPVLLPKVDAAVDRAGDPLPPGALARLGTVRLRHGGSVHALAFALDGKRIASGGGFSDNAVRLWDVDTGRQVGHFRGHTRLVLAVAFAPDGEALVSVDGDGNIRRWEAATGKELHQVTSPRHAVLAAVFAPDGAYLATAGKDGAVRLWQTASGVQRGPLIGHQGEVRGVAFSPDGKLLASAGADGTVRLWEVATLKELRRFDGFGAAIHCVRFAPDGKRLAAAGLDKTLLIWDVATGDELGRGAELTSAVNGVAFAPDGKLLAVAGEDGTLILLDAATGRTRCELRGHLAPVGTLVFSPDGKVLASGSGGWDKENRLRLWDVATAQERSTPDGHDGWVFPVALVDGGRHLVTSSPDGAVRRWELSSGKPLAAFPGYQSRGKAVAVSPDGRAVATGGSDGTARLFDLATGAELRRFAGHKSAVLSIAFLPDGKTLVSGGADRTIRLWDVTTAKEREQLRDVTDVSTCFALAADGRTLFAGSESGPVRVWDLASGQPVGTLNGHTGAVEWLVLSADGTRLASAGVDQTCRVWETTSGKELHRLAGSFGYVYGVAFSPDGHTLATATGDRVIRLYEVATGLPCCRFEGHQGAGAGILFGPDGRTLVSGSSDGTALVWDLTGHARQPPPPLTNVGAQGLWKDLLGGDAAKPTGRAGSSLPIRSRPCRCCVLTSSRRMPSLPIA